MAAEQRVVLVSLVLLLTAALRGGGALPPPPSASHSVAVANAMAAADDAKEPSCEELRAMWRFSKRQSRAAQINNEIPTYRDPFAYPIWEPRPGASAGQGGPVGNPRTGSLRSGRRFVYATQRYPAPRYPGDGSMRHATINRYPIATSAGSMQELKNLIRMERARELEQQRMAEEASARTRIYKKPSAPLLVDGPVSALDLVRLEGMSKDPAMGYSMSMDGGEVVKRDPESVDYVSDVADVRTPQQVMKGDGTGGLETTGPVQHVPTGPGSRVPSYIVSSAFQAQL